MNGTVRILLVNANHAFASTLCGALEIEGFTVDIAPAVEEAHQCMALHAPALIVLDIMAAGESGCDLLQALRDHGVHDVPVIVLMACSDETEVLRGFALGADDFMTKPVHLPEFLARVRALVRRVSPEFASASPMIRFGDIEVQPAARMVRRGGETVALSPKEFDLLMALVRRRDRIVSREEILQDVLGFPHDGQDRRYAYRDPSAKTGARSRFASARHDCPGVRLHAAVECGERRLTG